jgi:hypothetical protein
VTRRTILLLVGLFYCWSAEALAQTVDTSATDALTEQAASAITQQVEATIQELEAVTDQGSSTDGSTTSPAGSRQANGSSSSTESGQECEVQAMTNGGSERGGTAGGGGPGEGGPRAPRAGARDGVLATRREPGREGGVLAGTAEGGTTTESREPLPTPLPKEPNGFAFWGGIAALGLGWAGFVAVLRAHLFGRTLSG